MKAAQYVFELYDPSNNISILSTQLDGIMGNPPSINAENGTNTEWCEQVSPMEDMR